MNPSASEAAELIPVGRWLPWLDSMADIPQLEPLWAIIKPEVYTRAADLEKSARDFALSWATLLERAAAEYNLSLVSCEMSVIADQRRQAHDAQLYFTSYISIFSPFAEALHEAYREGFERGSDPSNPATKRFLYDYPIVIHPQLFKPNTGFFYKSFSGASSGDYPSDTPAPVLYAYGYPLEGKVGAGPAKLVPQQLDDFVTIFQRTAEAKGAGVELRGATLALVPFVRPEYAPPGRLSSDDGPRATPGGCIFFVFRGHVGADDSRLRGYLRSVRWFLAEASAKESQSAFEASAQRQELTAGMLHGTVTALRSIRAFSIRDMLLRARADRRDFGVDDLIVDIKGDPEKVARHKIALVEQLKRMVIAEDIATSLTGLAQIRSDGLVRLKHQSNKTVTVRDLIARAWFIACGTEEEQRFKVKAGAADERVHDWDLPSGYIRDSLLLGVLMELFRNAIEHSGSSLQKEIEVQVSVFGTQGESVVRIQNPRDASDDTPPPRGFISQAKMLFDDIDGLGLSTTPLTGDTPFIAELKLGRVKREVDRNADSASAKEPFASPNRREVDRNADSASAKEPFASPNRVGEV